MFHSKERNVYEWEKGICIPLINRLMNISIYFGVSMDCILCGRVVGDGCLEEMLSKSADMHAYEKANRTGQLINRLNSLPNRYKERLYGYLEALYNETKNMHS